MRDASNLKISTVEQLFNDITSNKLSDLRDITTSINYDKQNRFNVIVTTPKLYLKNSGSHDEEEYQQLMQNPDNMLTFHRGTPHTQEEIRARVEKNQRRLENQNPYTNYGIYTKDNKFIGFIAFAAQETAIAVVVYIIDKNYWNQGYGKEATYATIYSLLPTLREHGYILKQISEQDPIKDSAVETVEATARQDNKASRKILKKIGFVAEGKPFYEKYDSENLRKLYKIHTSEILKTRNTLITKLDSEKPKDSSINKPLVEECSTIPASPTIISRSNIFNQPSSMQR